MDLMQRETNLRLFAWLEREDRPTDRSMRTSLTSQSKEIESAACWTTDLMHDAHDSHF